MKLSQGFDDLNDRPQTERDWYPRFASAIAKDRTVAARSTKKSLQYYQSFFEACRSSTIKSFPLEAEEILDESTEMLNQKNHGVCAYVLPPHLEKWPTFHASHQLWMIAPDVLCIRTDRISTRRRELVLEYLVKEKKIVVNVGSEGVGTKYVKYTVLTLFYYYHLHYIIGKSAEMNLILMTLLSRIGEVGWPSTVLFRMPHSPVLEFTLDASSQQCLVRGLPGTETLDQATECSERYDREDAVMLMELACSETDPIPAIPCYLTVTADDALGVTKTIRKMHGSRYVLSDPPSLIQLKLQGLAYKRHSRVANPFLDQSPEAILSTIEQRAQVVGPLSRHTICSEDDYELQQDNIRENADGFLSRGHTTLNCFQIPKYASYYIAPFIKPDCEPMFGTRAADGSPPYAFRFLSGHCALTIAQSIREQDGRLGEMQSRGLSI